MISPLLPEHALVAHVSLTRHHAAAVQYLFKSAGYPAPQTPAQRRLSEQMIGYFGRTSSELETRTAQSCPTGRVTSCELLSRRSGGNVSINNFDTDHRCEFWSTGYGSQGLN